MRNNKKINCTLLIFFFISLCSCNDEVNVPDHTVAANDLYELEKIDFYSDKGDCTDTVEYHIDTTFIYNYSGASLKEVKVSSDFKDTLSVSIMKGQEYLKDLVFQGTIKFPSSYYDNNFYDSPSGLEMPLNKQDSIFPSPVRYTSSTSMPPRSYLIHTGIYHQIVDHYSFQATFIGQKSHETICIQGKYRYSRATVQSFNGSECSNMVIRPIN